MWTTLADGWPKNLKIILHFLIGICGVNSEPSLLPYVRMHLGLLNFFIDSHGVLFFGTGYWRLRWGQPGNSTCTILFMGSFNKYYRFITGQVLSTVPRYYSLMGNKGDYYSLN